MLKEVDRICKLENIRYGIDGGTLLGAIRHKGFIPWDSDIDVIMLRADYERFYEAAIKYMDKEKYFLQEERTDKEYRWGFTKIRRNGTHFIRCGQEHLKMNNGVFIDVLIMDNVPDNTFKRKIFEFFCFCCRFIMWSEVGKYSEKRILIRILYKIANFIPVKLVFKWLKKVRDKNNLEETRLVRYMTCRYTYNKKLKGIERSFFENYQCYTFEDAKFPGFYEYDAYLTTLYGDYMTLPAIEKRVNSMSLSELVLIDEQSV